jgi:CSLREA domain-containing protein
MKEAFAMKRGELSKVLALLWAFICIVYAAPALAQPLTITVTTNADVVNNPWGDCPPPGTPDCSLREAILVANSNGAPGDVIVFDSSLNGATITLNPALGGLSIGIDTGTTIDATSLATGITIDANGIDFPLTLNSNTIAIQGPITITNAGAGGAAIVLNPGADGSSLVGITVSNNAGVGISIGNVSSVVLDGVTVANNQGGGITAWNSSASGIQIQNNCIVRDNAGTGIYINASGTSISGCTVERNGNGGISVDSGGVGTTVSSKITQEDQESTLRPRSR